MRFLVPTLVLGFVLAAGPALAQEGGGATSDDPVTRAEHHSRLGVEFYEQKRYPEAIREMLAAYQAIPDPTLLYNVARIYEAMGQSELAVDYFTRFVKADDADPDTVQEALEHMAAIQGGTTGGEDASTESSPPVGNSQDPSDDAGAVRVAPPARVDEPDNKAVGGQAVQPFVSVAAAVSVGAGVTLGTTGLLALAFHDRARMESLDYGERIAAKNTAAQLAIAADAALGVTVAAAVTTGVLALVARAQNKPVVLAPVGPNGSLGLTLSAPLGSGAVRSR